MSGRRLTLIVYVCLLVISLSLLLAACGPPQNPQVYQEGRWARRIFDQLVRDARDFLSGFCGPAPLGLVFLGMSVAAWRKRRV